MGTIYTQTPVNTGTGSAQTIAQSVAAVAGRHVWVHVTAMTNFHLIGLDSEWSISGGTGITWTQRHLSAKNTTVNANYLIQSVVYSSDQIAADQTFTVTVDPHNSGTRIYRLVMSVWQYEGGTGQLIQAASIIGESVTAQTQTVTYPSAPSITGVPQCPQISPCKQAWRYRPVTVRPTLYSPLPTRRNL
jgi:hypothetical protein